MAAIPKNTFGQTTGQTHSIMFVDDFRDVQMISVKFNQSCYHGHVNIPHFVESLSYLRVSISKFLRRSRMAA